MITCKTYFTIHITVSFLLWPFDQTIFYQGLPHLNYDWFIVVTNEVGG